MTPSIRKLTLLLSCLLGAVVVEPTASAGPPTGPDEDPLSEYQAPLLDPGAIDGSDQKGTHIRQTPAVGTNALNQRAETSQIFAPSCGGTWRYAASFGSSFNPVHVVTGPRDKVLLIAGSGHSELNHERRIFRTILWNTRTNSRREIPTPRDLFCAGHLLLRDGRALVVGGTTSYEPYKGSRTLYAFNFITERYEKLPNLSFGRWYPTVVTTPNGDALVVGGLNGQGLLADEVELVRYRVRDASDFGESSKLPVVPAIVPHVERRIFLLRGGLRRI